jgi:rhodanese-related sulfurtransferase
MKRSFIRIAIILTTAVLLGLVYNQFYPKGIKINLLFHSSLLIPKDNTQTFYVISTDSATILHEQPAVTFLDIRPREDYQLDHIPGANHVDFNQLLNGTFKDFSIKPGDKIIIYDQEGKMEQLHLAAILLRQSGYTDIFILFGGYLKWLEKGFAIESGETEDG